MDVDPELVRAVQRGTPGAMEALIEATYAGVHRHCLSLLGDPVDAADATQEVFLRVTRSVLGFRGEAAFGTWLHRVTVNVCLTALRRRADARARGTAAGAEPFAVPGARRDVTAEEDVERTVAREVEVQQRTAAVAAAMATLSADDREVIMLRDVKGLSTRQTAKALGISESAAKVRLHRAHARLREAVAS
ncbi:MAG: RNA polymerase sigma factor [Actinomycetes bacterium]